MNTSRAGGCTEEHVTGASEFHSDGRLCGEWLSEQEHDHWGTLDHGQLLRLQKSLSLTQPPKRRIKEISISLTPPRFRIELE